MIILIYTSLGFLALSMICICGVIINLIKINRSLDRSLQAGIQYNHARFTHNEKSLEMLNHTNTRLQTLEKAVSQLLKKDLTAKLKSKDKNAKTENKL